ncbi:hypothetical protein ACWKSP_14960 [Micromonosporaceae bacterium Da 78-11]
MAHSITALIVRQPWDEAAAQAWDVNGLSLDGGLRLVPLDHHYSAYWQTRRAE